MSELTAEDLLRTMCRKGASDLLLTAGTAPQFRINGELHALGGASLCGGDVQRLAFSLLSDEQKERLWKHKSLDFSKGVEGLSRFRFNVYYQRNTVAMAVRMIPFLIPAFEELGLPEVVRTFASRPHGLVLITGPAGSGKSTTLASMIDHINQTRRVHVICIEDPIEYLHAHNLSIVEQREVSEDTHSFTNALRSVFRQSPDVIMLGEMRDLETIQLALTLAETGHLILTTLHTQDTSHAITRIVDMFPATQQQQIYTQLSQVLVGVVAQRLVMTQDARRRVMVYEVLKATNAVRNLVREAQIQQIYSVIQTSRGEQMITMNDRLRELLDAGMIDEAAARQHSPRPKELTSMLGGRSVL